MKKLVLLSALVPVLVAFGQVIPAPTSVLPTADPCQGLTFGGCIQLIGGNIANILFMVTMIGAVVLFLLGAMFYVLWTAAQDSEGANKAKGWLIVAIQGAAFAVIAWIAVRIVVFAAGRIFGA